MNQHPAVSDTSDIGSLLLEIHFGAAQASIVPFSLLV